MKIFTCFCLMFLLWISHANAGALQWCQSSGGTFYSASMCSDGSMQCIFRSEAGYLYLNNLGKAKWTQYYPNKWTAQCISSETCDCTSGCTSGDRDCAFVRSN